MTNKRLIIGTGFQNNKKDFNKKNFLESLNIFFKNKIYDCDTADGYFNGEIQCLISEFKYKNDLKIINKFNYYNNFNLLVKNLNKSLDRLKIDRFDTYMPHWPTNDIDLNLLSDFAEYCLEREKIKYFGLSNFDLQLIKSFVKVFKKKICIQFELNIKNFFFYKNLINYCENSKFKMMCYGINNYFPNFLKKISSNLNISDYELSLNWISNFKSISPIIRSLSEKNIKKNILIFKNPKKLEIKINNKSIVKSIKISDIKKINSGSGVCYKSISEAVKNKFNLYPSPLDISKEIKKEKISKPFYIKKISSGYELIKGQARYWGYRILNKKKIKSIIID